MKFKPFDRMWDVVETQKDFSDTDYFNALMYFGEMVTKFTVAALVAAVDDGRERHQYRLKQKLVQSDGVGAWSQVLEEILNVVPAQHTFEDIRGHGNESFQLTRVTKAGEWQYDSTKMIHDCLRIVDPNTKAVPKRLAAKTWFEYFAALRNRRAHDALPSGVTSSVCRDLHSSIILMINNLRLYKRPWAYLSPNLNGKYRVIRWTEEAHSLDMLKSVEGKQYQFEPGVYIHYGNTISQESLRKADLIFSDVDATDFFLPNGGWNGKRYKVHSCISNRTMEQDAQLYLVPSQDLPPSETQSLTSAVGMDNFHTMPTRQTGYVERPEPEECLYSELVDDNQHRIVTLVGRGGIGKTWLTLEVLHRIFEEKVFTAILWFSSRDIDLLTDGAKPVQPHILNEEDIANEFFKHVGPFFRSAEAMDVNRNDKSLFLRNNLFESSLGKMLFVFDNFETVTSPIGLYNWIDHYLRLPNKALITTRMREFRGDYPVELHGMTREESKKLIDVTSRELHITHLITDEFETELINASDGHPYVMKILLGEVKKAGKTGRIERIIAGYDEILDTLFERTYERLSPTAKRIFLTLCNWKSLIGETAIKAVLLRPKNEEMGYISSAIEELYNSSMIEKNTSSVDPETYWGVNLVARQFGLRKLEIDASKMAIEADTKFLRFFGTTQKTDVTRGIKSRLERLFNEIRTQALRDHDPVPIEEFEPIVEQVAKRQHPDAWLHLAELYKNRKLNNPTKFEQTLKRYLEFSNDIEGKMKAWEKLANYYQSDSRFFDELFARIQLAQLPHTRYERISKSVNRFNQIRKERSYIFDEGEKEEIVDLLIELMENRIDEANDDDCSRLGWLYMQSKQNEKALQAAERGLAINPKNNHCLNLKAKAHDAISQQLPFSLT